MPEVNRSDAVRPASTVLLLRDGSSGLEVFMVRRRLEAAFMGGAHVFPGGRVDPADGAEADGQWCDGIAAAESIPGLTPGDALAHRVAAVRELFEEAGVLLARDAAGRFVSFEGDHGPRFARYRHELHGGVQTLREIIQHEHLHLALEALGTFAHWVTPPIDTIRTHRFDTWFFVTRVPPDQTPAHDGAETTRGVWVSPTAALRQGANGEIVLPPPTWTTLRELEPFGSVGDALAWAAGRHTVGREPRLVERGGQTLLVLPGDPLSADPWPEVAPRETRFVLVDGWWRASEAHP